MPDSPVDDRLTTAADGAAELPGRIAGDDRLRDRLERLPPGHPSSPYEADGKRREVESRWNDSHADDTAEEARTFTDAEWKDHLADVKDRLADANRQGLASLDRYALDQDGEARLPERQDVHSEIVSYLYDQAADIPCEHKAIIAGGMAGAGKTTVLANHAGVDRSQYLTINPDDIKEEMARRGLIPDIEGLSPMEASDLVHPEASFIAKELAARARADGKNVIWDITMASRESTERRISDLREAGYTSISAVFVDISVEVSLTRAEARHRYGEEMYRNGEGLGGRYVPADFITSQADEQWGSKNRKTLEEIKHQVDAWTIFDNDVDGRDPMTIEAGSRDNPEDQRRGAHD
jgi:predicted ABC-type ATPase